MFRPWPFGRGATAVVRPIVLAALVSFAHELPGAAAPAAATAPAAAQMVVTRAPGATAPDIAALHARLGARVVRVIPALDIEVVRLDGRPADAPLGEAGPAAVAEAARARRAYAESALVADVRPDGAARIVTGGRAPAAAWLPRLARGAQGAPSPARPPAAAGRDGRVPLAALSPRTLLARPDDPRLATQWLVDVIGLPDAWDVGHADGVVVAIVDTGVDCAHEDLAAACVAGYDVVNGDDDPSDDNRHGTIEAGVAAAVTNNRRGIAGVAWGARIMPLKAMDAAGQGSTSAIAEAIVWAADHGAHVVNLSLGSDAPEPALERAVTYARDRGIVVVAASGNGGRTGVLYPAAYPSVIAVGATTRADTLAAFSNTGPEIDLVAPGWQIVTTDLGGAYGTFDGTSEATAVVSGVAALIAARDGRRKPEAVAELLARTAVDLGPPGRDDHFGHGRVDAAAAMAAAAPPVVPPPTAPCRPRHVDLVAFPDTVGRGGPGCAGCDRVYAGGDRASAALCPLGALRVTLATANGLPLGETTLAPGADGVARARIALCAAPPYLVTLETPTSACYVLCPTTPAVVTLDAGRFARFGRSTEVIWGFGHCHP